LPIAVTAASKDEGVSATRLFFSRLQIRTTLSLRFDNVFSLATLKTIAQEVGRNSPGRISIAKTVIDGGNRWLNSFWRY